MNPLLVKFHTLFLPELSEGRLGVGWVAGNLFSNTKQMAGGHHASLCREMLVSELRVQALATQFTRVSLPNDPPRAAKIFKGIAKRRHVLLEIWKRNVCDWFFLEQ